MARRGNFLYESEKRMKHSIIGHGRRLLVLLCLLTVAAKPAMAQLALSASPTVMYPGGSVTLTATGGYIFGDTYNFYVGGSSTPFATVNGSVIAMTSYALPAAQPFGPLTFRVTDTFYNATGTVTITVANVIDADALTINGVSNQFAGVPMTAQNIGGVATFTLIGDVTLNNPIYVQGSRPVNFFATNDLTLASAVTIDVSGIRATARGGGGVSGVVGACIPSVNGGAGGSGEGFGSYDYNGYDGYGGTLGIGGADGGAGGGGGIGFGGSAGGTGGASGGGDTNFGGTPAGGAGGSHGAGSDGNGNKALPGAAVRPASQAAAQAEPAEPAVKAG